MDVLERLQSLDQPTKKKVLIALTAIIMAIVVYFWLVYFNSLIASVAQPPVAENQPAANQSAEGALASSGAGIFGRIYEQFMRIPRILSHIFQTPQQYIVHPPQ